jgi:hypothetical protein
MLMPGLTPPNVAPPHCRARGYGDGLVAKEEEESHGIKKAP